MVTSPVASVCKTSVLPSDVTTVPVRQSPFFRVTWSANRADDSPRIAIRVTNENSRNTTYLQISGLFGMHMQFEARDSPLGRGQKQGRGGGAVTQGIEPRELAPTRVQPRTRLAFGFSFLVRIGRSLRGRLFLHAVLKAANALGQPFSKFRQFLGPEQQKSNDRYE